MTNNREYTNEEISIALKKIRDRLNTGIITIGDYKMLKYLSDVNANKNWCCFISWT